MGQISFPRRLSDLAQAGPAKPAFTCGEKALSRRDLEQRGEALAHQLLAHGVTSGDMVTIALPNCVEWAVAVVATWKVGAIPQPVSPDLPRPELEAILGLASPKVIVGELAGAWDAPQVRVTDEAAALRGLSALPDVVSPAWKASTSGGSTGRPKLIVSGDAASIDPEGSAFAMFQSDGCVVVPAPLHHAAPMALACFALLSGCHVVSTPRFEPRATLAAVQQHRGTLLYLVPTMMRRIWRLPEQVRNAFDLSTLVALWHTAEPCPIWLKALWIEWLGPERVFELYSATEAQLATVITGSEWLEHRGSVGRPTSGEIMICDELGAEVPRGDPGEVWLRPEGTAVTYRYVGAVARSRSGGWESLGDNGWVDADGYLYLGDRMQDMILVGGRNAYPAEIEAALQEHPEIASCAVIGLPDEDTGSRIHALIEAVTPTLTEEAIRDFLTQRLVRWKHPRTFEFVHTALRDDSGKIRRSQLRADRLEPTPTGDQRHEPPALLGPGPDQRGRSGP